MSTADKAELDELAIEMIIDAGMAFSWVDNPSVKKFFAKLRPVYQLPTRKEVRVGEECTSVRMQVFQC